VSFRTPSQVTRITFGLPGDAGSRLPSSSMTMLSFFLVPWMRMVPPAKVAEQLSRLRASNPSTRGTKRRRF
jgi:hypothetical protein